MRRFDYGILWCRDTQFGREIAVSGGGELMGVWSDNV
jgi:hypothetical protein